MNRRDFWLGLVFGTISTCLLGQWVFSAAGKETDFPKCISPKTVADYIHSVVQADRTGEATETSPYPPNFYSNPGGSRRTSAGRAPDGAEGAFRRCRPAGDCHRGS